MFESSRSLHLYNYSSFNMFIRIRKRLHLLYLLVSLNIIFFLIVYRRLILITPSSSSSSALTVSSVDLSISSFIESNEQYDQQMFASSICYIPRFDPWDQSVAKSLRIKPVYRCPMNKQSLIQVINHTQLYFNETVNRMYYANSITHCVYMKVDRNPDERFFRDWSYTLSEPVLIIDGQTAPILDADFVLTRCYNNRTRYFDGDRFCGYNCSTSTDKKASKTPGLVYEYIHPLFRLKKPAFSREQWLNQKDSHWLSNLISPSSSFDRSPPSVLMVILDAVSDLQARRALPQTLSYLKSQGLFTFQRHTIVGDGTFENLVPMLFGESADGYQKENLNDSRYEFIRVETKTNPKTKRRYQIRKTIHYPGPYDDDPLIMKKFAKFNYTTFFSEEWRESAFYNLKNGFRQAPTDYYLRPYWLSLYETMSYNKYAGNSNPKPCYLNKLLHFLSLNWLEEFLGLHHKTPDYPTFGVMKMNEMSHDYLERLFWIDYDLKNFFENLIQRNLLTNTIVIFCGDHGHRQHRLRLTRIGSFEVKLPFFSILLPPTFKQFSQAMKNMKENEQVLTSWWDVYETLANILKMVEQPQIFDPALVDWQPTTPGISLFHPIPERNCSSAGIPEKYCPCSRSTPLDITLPLIKELAIASVDYINNVKLKSHTHLCVPLELKTIIRAEVEKLPVTKKPANKTNTTASFTHSYTVLFEVAPSGGIFESRLLYDEQTKKPQLHSDILRINLYGQTSSCIQDKYELRSFCYCISYHQKLQDGSTKSITIQSTSNLTMNNSTNK